MANQAPVPSELADRPNVVSAWAMMGQVLDDIQRVATGFHPMQTVSVVGYQTNKDYGQVSFADLLTKLPRVAWALTPEGFDNGGAGEVVSAFHDPVHSIGWISAAEQINVDDFMVYASWPDRTGLHYLALHEIGHTTDLGLQANLSLWSSYLARGGRPTAADYANTPEWTLNEQIVNGIAASFAQALGFPILPQPNPGFPPLVMVRNQGLEGQEPRTTGA